MNFLADYHTCSTGTGDANNLRFSKVGHQLRTLLDLAKSPLARATADDIDFEPVRGDVLLREVDLD